MTYQTADTGFDLEDYEFLQDLANSREAGGYLLLQQQVGADTFSNNYRNPRHH